MPIRLQNLLLISFGTSWNSSPLPCSPHCGSYRHGLCEYLCISIPVLPQVKSCGLTYRATKICTVDAKYCDDYGYDRGGKVADQCGSWRNVRNLVAWTNWYALLFLRSKKSAFVTNATLLGSAKTRRIFSIWIPRLADGTSDTCAQLMSAIY